MCSVHKFLFIIHRPNAHASHFLDVAWYKVLLIQPVAVLGSRWYHMWLLTRRHAVAA